MKLKITAVEFSTRQRIDVNDLYWFEKNGVHWFDCPEFYFEFDISPSETVSSKPLKLEIQSTPGTSVPPSLSLIESALGISTPIGTHTHTHAIRLPGEFVTPFDEINLRGYLDRPLDEESES